MSAKTLDVPMPAEGPVSVHLVNKHPGHSKYYDVALKREGSGFVVMATYGAIGGNATPWPIVSTPVGFAEAWAAYAKRIRTQIETKGYTTNADGVTMVPWQEALGSKASPAQVSAEPVAAKIHSGWEPLLLKDLDERLDLPRVLGDDGWAAQEKLDGHRISLKKEGPLVRGINRTGYYRSIPDSVIATAQRLPYRDVTVLDGELIGEVYYAFDLLMVDGSDLTRMPYEERWAALADLVEGTGLVAVTIKRTPVEKRNLLETLRRERAEGIVFKRLHAPYRPGRTDDYLRYKFVKELDAVVSSINDRKSVGLQLRSGKDWVDVGNVTLTKGLPKVGDVITVRYLYCLVGGKLYQPRIMKIRGDKKPNECTLDQIIYKKGENADGNGNGA
jgi:bifunctional non-homologous end joining protein LigD